nr:ribosomal protein L20 [Haplothismia exannulata]
MTKKLSRAHSRLTRIAAQHKTKAWIYSHRDRGSRLKRDFRRLWIIRINAVARDDFVFRSYSQFICSIQRRHSLLNRKILAQIAVSNLNLSDFKN